jgi:hypothetical protein
MSSTVQQPTTEPYEEDESYEEDEFYEHDVEPFYYCAYCNEDRGRDSMNQMCADCFWEYDSLYKRPGRIRWSLLDPKYASPEEQERVLRWVKEANQELAEFEEKLEAGQERIHRELEVHEVYGVMGFGADSVEPTEPKSLQEMTENELHYRLIALDNERKQMRYTARDRAMTPEELEEYAAKDRATGECVQELLRRRK